MYFHSKQAPPTSPLKIRISIIYQLCVMYAIIYSVSGIYNMYLDIYKYLYHLYTINTRYVRVQIVQALSSYTSDDPVWV